MAIKPAEEGFFTTSGALKQDSVAGRRAASSTAAGNNSTDQAVIDKAASATAGGIAQAAVVKISGRMGVGNTGFDSGVSSMVEQAISLGKQAQSDRKNQAAASASSNTQSATKVDGGSYQNQILYGSTGQPSASAPAAPAAPSTPSDPAGEQGTPRKAIGGRYQNELIDAENKRRAKEKEAAAASTSGNGNSQQAQAASPANGSASNAQAAPSAPKASTDTTA